MDNAVQKWHYAFMARPKEFDRSQALAKAMDVFWARGYAPVTMTELRGVMGIGRQSLYDTFGDKSQLFTEALAQYVSMNDADVSMMLAHDDPMAGIREFLYRRVQMLTTGPRRGCLMVNTCIESIEQESAATTLVSGGLSRMRSELAVAIERAQRGGQISDESSPAELALYLTAHIAGLVVMSKDGASVEELQGLADRAVRGLR